MSRICVISRSFTLTTASMHPCCSFFSRSAHHRDLHSFPTRRSSDLRRADGRASAPAGTSSDGRRRNRNTTAAATTGRRCGPRRSEEHTSELQSRQYLVCRLLLEKKNTSGQAVSAWLSVEKTFTLMTM